MSNSTSAAVLPSAATVDTMASPSDILANIKQTVQTSFKGYQTLKYPLLESTRTSEFIYQFLPHSLGSPAQTNEEYKTLFFNVLKPGFTKFDTRAISTTYDVEQRKATVYGHVDCDGVAGPGSMEFVMMMSFSEDGTKLTRIDEYLDTEFYRAYFKRVGEGVEGKR